MREFPSARPSRRDRASGIAGICEPASDRRRFRSRMPWGVMNSAVMIPFPWGVHPPFDEFIIAEFEGGM